jgi:tryptophan 6-halogenase
MILISLLLKSDALGIIGVGEGSTEHWRLFMNFCNITNEELIKETDATLKYGILFENWTKHKYFHNITYEMADTKCGQYLSGFAYSIINNLTPKEYTTSGCFL